MLIPSCLTSRFDPRTALNRREPTPSRARPEAKSTHSHAARATPFVVTPNSFGWTSGRVTSMNTRSPLPSLPSRSRQNQPQAFLQIHAVLLLCRLQLETMCAKLADLNHVLQATPCELCAVEGLGTVVILFSAASVSPDSNRTRVINAPVVRCPPYASLWKRQRIFSLKTSRCLI
jgi:hypothetical protein